VSRYIISERWQVTFDNGDPYVKPAPWDSPTAAYNAQHLTAQGLQKDPTFIGAHTYNAFDDSDVVLIKRMRLWSPCCALGLVGATADQSHEIRLHTTRFTNPNVDQVMVITGPLVLGEWVDVNQTLLKGALPGPDTHWRLGLEMPFPIKLDASRMTSSLVGVGGTTFTNLTFQVDLAHTLPAVYIP